MKIAPATALAALLTVVAVPSIAQADRYDRGDRYRGHRSGHEYRHRDHDRSRFSFSFGLSSGGYYHGDRSSFHLGYSKGYGHYRPRHYHYRAPVIVREHYYAPPPVYYYAPSPRVYYYDSCGPRYYRSSHYYYGR